MWHGSYCSAYSGVACEVESGEESPDKFWFRRVQAVSLHLRAKFFDNLWYAMTDRAIITGLAIVETVCAVGDRTYISELNSLVSGKVWLIEAVRLLMFVFKPIVAISRRVGVGVGRTCLEEARASEESENILVCVDLL